MIKDKKASIYKVGTLNNKRCKTRVKAHGKLYHSQMVKIRIYAYLREEF